MVRKSRLMLQFFSLLTAGMVVLGAGCASTSSAAAATAVSVPDWVLNGAKSSDAAYWYAVGQAKLPTEQNSLKMARMQARGELASILNTQVKKVVRAKQTMNSAGENSQELTQYFEALTDALLQGCEQVGRYNSADGTVYVLMSLPKNNAVKKLNESVAGAAGGGKPLVTLEDFN